MYKIGDILYLKPSFKAYFPGLTEISPLYCLGYFQDRRDGELSIHVQVYGRSFYIPAYAVETRGCHERHEPTHAAVE